MFAGEANDLADLPDLRPATDASELFSSHPHFRPLSRTYWTRFPVAAGPDKGLWAVTKCSVSLPAGDSRRHFCLTRQDGLPRFIRSVAATTQGLVVSGNGLTGGLATVSPSSEVARLGRDQGCSITGAFLQRRSPQVGEGATDPFTLAVGLAAWPRSPASTP